MKLKKIIGLSLIGTLIVVSIKTNSISKAIEQEDIEQYSNINMDGTITEVYTEYGEDAELESKKQNENVVDLGNGYTYTNVTEIERNNTKVQSVTANVTHYVWHNGSTVFSVQQSSTFVYEPISHVHFSYGSFSNKTTAYGYSATDGTEFSVNNTDTESSHQKGFTLYQGSNRVSDFTVYITCNAQGSTYDGFYQ